MKFSGICIVASLALFAVVVQFSVAMSEYFIVIFIFSHKLEHNDQLISPDAYRFPRQLNHHRQYNAGYEAPEVSDVAKTTGPVFTIVKTDQNANFKWGVRHYVGRRYH